MRLASFADSVRPGAEVPGAVPLAFAGPESRRIDVVYGDLSEVRYPAGVPLSFPLDMCCNCGATEGPLHVVAVDAPWATLLRRGHFYLALPHCFRCVSTARRRRMSLGDRVAIGATSFVCAAVAVASIALSFTSRLEVALGLGLLAAAIVTALFVVASSWPRKPLARQTSAFAAVSALRVDASTNDGPPGVTLGFANAEYARRAAAHVTSLAYQLGSKAA